MAVDLLTPFTKVELEPEITVRKHGIGLFWGTFNPVHIAHLTIADQVRQQLHLEKIVFLPEQPTDKITEMLRLATDGKTGLEVDHCRQGATSSIFETVKAMKEKDPETDIYMIVGGDMIGGLVRWPDIDELCKLVTFVAVLRPRYRAGTSIPLIWVDIPAMDISSTQIREMVAKGLTPNFLLSPKVLAYVKKEGLYA